MEGSVSGTVDKEEPTSQTPRESEAGETGGEKDAKPEQDCQTREDEREPVGEGEGAMDNVREEPQRERAEAEEEGATGKTVESGNSEEPVEEDSESGSETSSDEDGDGKEGEAGGEEAGGSGQQSSRKEMMERLRELHKRRLDARQLNHREVVEEDRRNKLPANWEARQRRLEWEEEDDKARQEAEAEGLDYEREKLLKTSAAELERLQRKRKKNPDPGFSDYAQAQFRQYDRLTKQLKPDMEAYERQRMEMGDDFYPGVNTLVHGGAGKVSKEGIERMTEDLAKQVEKRSKYSRRRAYNPDSDVDYINERNMRFNKKAARYYDKYTAEIKQNLERGTAI